jgi:NAD(P)-dependent dehydrogenase (short-subunit alcohol dehydrogenase family)
VTNAERDCRKRAVVTGSSSGIGLAIATRLAQNGYDLVMHGLEDGAALADATRAVESLGAKVVCLSGDIRDPQVPKALVELANSDLGGLDGLVNNAGAGLTKPFVELDRDDWTSLLTMHLGAATAACHAAYPTLRKSGGSVVNISSVAAVLALPGRVGYGAAKAAVEGFTRNLACEWGADGIRVNAIAPGTIETPLVQRNFEQGLLNADAVLDRTPMRRFGRPSEIAAVASFLLSTDASYMTGQTLRVDGGWSCWGGWS